MFMTEPLATLMLALLAWTWVRNASAGWTTRRAIASGIAMGGLLAARTIFILTTPVLLILPGKDLSFGSKLAWKTKAICLAVAIVVISPWWIRNIVVLDAFMPLGTQGGINLPMGFGPRALRSQGIWASNPGDGWPEIAALKLDIVTSEVMLAKHRQTLTLNWMMDNPAQVLHLMRLHVVAGTEARTRLVFAMAAACGRTVGADSVEVPGGVGAGADRVRQHSQRCDDLQRRRPIHGPFTAAARGARGGRGGVRAASGADVAARHVCGEPARVSLMARGTIGRSIRFPNVTRGSASSRDHAGG